MYHKNIVYKLTNTITNKSYIGCTSKTINVRFNEHVRHSRREDSLIGKAINKYGESCWTKEVLFVVTSDIDIIQTLDAAEDELIETYNTIENGYNAAKTLYRQCNYSDETRKKLSDRWKGKNNPNYGITRSEEHLRKLSESLKGRPSTIKPEMKLKEWKCPYCSKVYSAYGVNKHISKSHPGRKKIDTADPKYKI